MNKSGLFTNTLIGKITKKDIYSHRGVLLLPASTMLTFGYLKKLIQHGIVLNIQDVTSIESADVSFQHTKVIDKTTVELKQIFKQVRETKQIPLADLRENILPIIQQISTATPFIGLLNSLQSKDDYTYRHNLAVSALSSLIGKWLGLDHKTLLQLSTAALLHDIGKIYIPESILNKPDRLTDQEFSIMKNHTIFGYEIIENSIGTTHRQALVALQHHERMDGSGYPFGIFKSEIDLFSRIVAVADVFHAMTSKRIYKNASPFYEVLLQLENDTFGALDPFITRIFVERIMNSLIGSSVLLTDGSRGIIRMIPKHDPVHPLVQINDNYIDLSKISTIHIDKII
ncbi:HD-GYP domain-containing protein [Pseudogracilibacillus sp. SE30717A]|uniref:HD-GYP domain-containing protein n=1 Tax=Pseudogracilibacillus sp. SE30717A TaxID=3098293 RepID=UPI00300E6A01